MLNLLFDLDGTLTDPEKGITLCIQHALLNLGRQPPPVEQLRHYIGPPLRQTFAELLATEDTSLIEAAINHYRLRFSTIGLCENKVYSDVPESLLSLREAGHQLWVVTSKPTVYARRIIDYFRLSPLFKNIYGSELSGKNTDKSDLIAHMLKCERISTLSAHMIGDRAQDIVGGRANGTGTIGVLWGYGCKIELKRAAPDILVDSMDSLVSYIGEVP